MAIAPALPLRTPQRWFDIKFEFLVVVEKDGDTAYLGSDWTEGITPWEFGSDLDLSEQNSLLRGTVFADRGVYRLGEEVHFKAILRNDTPTGIKVPDAGTQVYVMVRDSQDREVDQRTVRLSAWGSAEWTETLPADGALGNYSVMMRLRPFHEPAPKPSTQLVRELGVEGEVQSEDAGRRATRFRQRRLSRRGVPAPRLPGGRHPDERRRPLRALRSADTCRPGICLARP